MEILNKREEETKMADRIKSIFEEINKIFTIHCKLNMLAMCSLQSLGYNGFKKWHCYRCKQFLEFKLELATELFDKFRIKADFKEYDITYAPQNVEEHLKSWDSILLEAVKELGTLSKEYYEETGTHSYVLKCALKEISKDYERTGRYLKRFKESDWLVLDMHIVDEYLRGKFK